MSEDVHDMLTSRTCSIPACLEVLNEILQSNKINVECAHVHVTRLALGLWNRCEHERV